MPPNEAAAAQLRRLDRLDVNRPKLVRSAGKGGPGIETWAAFGKVYPSHVVVNWPPLEPFEHWRVWEQTAGDTCYRTHRIHFRNLGRVVISGVMHGEGPPPSVHVAALPDPASADSLLALEDVCPLGWERLDQLVLSDLLLQRLRMMMLGLSAYAYLADPDLYGGRDPLLAMWASSWRLDDGIPSFNARMLIDLCDPMTWVK